MPSARLHKVMADAGIASRRASEEMIRAGRVSVDGHRASIGEAVDPETQVVLVDGRPLPKASTERLYWMLNKPAGVVSTVRDRHAEMTVMDLLPAEVRARARLYPVGRLDEGSEGLLLFTNDGPWAEILLHPRYGVEREYMVGLDRSLTTEQKAALRAGIELEEGLGKAQMLEEASRAEVARTLALLQPPHEDLRWYRVVLTQGWKRQIRRMFDAVGQPVRRLVRVRIGSLKLVDLAPGQARALDHREVRLLSAGPRPREQASRSGGSNPRPRGTVSSEDE